MRRYRVHGVTIATDHPLGLRASAATDVDLELLVQGEPADADREPADLRPVYRGRVDAFGSDVEFFGPLDRAAIRFGRSMRFEFAPDRIVCHASNVEDSRIGEAFLGPVLALWLEERGALVLRGSAVVIDERVTVLLATDLADVEPLASAMVTHGATPLIGRVVPIEVEAGGAWTSHGADESTSGDGERLPVTRVVVVEPTTEPIAARAELRAREAVMALLRHSYLATPVVRYGLQPDRLRRIAHLLRFVRCERASLPATHVSIDQAAEQLVDESR